VQTINLLKLTDQPVVTKLLFEDWMPEFHSCKEFDTGGHFATEKCVVRYWLVGKSENINKPLINIEIQAKSVIFV
jgi:hypothetical protein